jgi:predicted Fe-Mo cluster-binding NifX family protein
LHTTYALAVPLVVAVAVREDGSIDPRWGRAERVALATVEGGAMSRWDEIGVGWGALHETGSERAHHARVARFVKQSGVQAVVASHMGGEMLSMLERMGVTVQLDASGDGRQAVLEVAATIPSGS